jgi:Tfp pilus assembly protein PilO
MEQTTQNQFKYKSYLSVIRGIYEKPIAQTSSALILTLVTITFFGLAAIKPTLSTVSQLIKELEEKKEIDEKLTKKLASLATVQEQYSLARQELEVFDTTIPSTQGLEDTLLQLEYLASINGTSLLNIRTSSLTTLGTPLNPTDKTQPFPEYTITITVEGTYGQLKFLLNQISLLKRLIVIESVAFTQSNIDGVTAVRATAQLKTFWNPQEKL